MYHVHVILGPSLCVFIFWSKYSVKGEFKWDKEYFTKAFAVPVLTQIPCFCFMWCNWGNNMILGQVLSQIHYSNWSQFEENVLRLLSYCQFLFGQPSFLPYYLLVPNIYFCSNLYCLVIWHLLGECLKEPIDFMLPITNV